MKTQLLGALGACLIAASPAPAFDTALYTHCLRWTPEAVGETWLGIALHEGFPLVSTPPTHPRAIDAYDQGVALFWEKERTHGRRAAVDCAAWVVYGTKLLGWRKAE